MGDKVDVQKATRKLLIRKVCDCIGTYAVAFGYMGLGERVQCFK